MRWAHHAGRPDVLGCREDAAPRSSRTRGVQCAAKHAQAASVRLAVEPLNRFETDLLNTVEQAMNFLQDSNCESVGLLLDTFHMTVEERGIPNARRRAGDRVFHFHACANDRGTPGNDHLLWRMIVTAPRDIG
jgi:D-psicose/D-tagatose/L-ribulose 3-epimerase